MKKPVQVFSYSIQNQSNGSVDIHIDGEIVDASTQAMMKAFFGDSTSTSYKSFRNSLDALKDVQVYNVIINSPGGHLGDALAIHDLITDLQSKGKTVNTKGIGIVASSATFILMAGKTPEMTANSWFMMHTASGGVFGTVKEIENYAATIRAFNDKARDVYAVRSGMRKEDVTKLMDAETWLTADQAKEKGFITNVIGAQPFINSIQVEDWPFADESIMNKYNESVKPADKLEDMKKYFTDMGNAIMNAIKGIKPQEVTAEKPFDQAAFMNSIGESISNTFKASAETIEAALTEVVTAQTTTVIKDATDKAVLPFEARIKKLETENLAFKTQIENVSGKQTGSNGKKDEVPKEIGLFS